MNNPKDVVVSYHWDRSWGQWYVRVWSCPQGGDWLKSGVLVTDSQKIDFCADVDYEIEEENALIQSLRFAFPGATVINDDF